MVAEIRELFAASPVVPVVVVDSPVEGLAVGRALLEGGVVTAEVTFRTAAAGEAIAVMSRDLPGLTVGAGTVVNAAQAREAIAAGARYVVSPGFSRPVVEECQRVGVPVLPACTDGSWIMAALEMGIDTVKFFPAGINGGAKAIRALSAPFPQVGFVPTGGVGPGNLSEYLDVPSVVACGGSWLVDRKLVEAGAWGEVTRLSAEALEIAREAGR